MYKFIINSTDLSLSLSTVSKVIISRNTLPILDCVLFAQDGDNFTITGASTENELTRTLATMQITDGDFSPVCVNAKLLTNIINQLADQPLEVVVDEKKLRFTMNYQNGTFETPCYLTDEYPRRKAYAPADIQIAFSADPSELIPAMLGAQVCTLKEDTVRPVLNTVCIDAKADGYVVTASDGHKLYKESFTPGAPFLTSGKPATILIPSPLVKPLHAAFGKAASVDIQSDGHTVHFTTNDTSMYISVVEGRYPNYNAVIPKNQPYHATVDAHALIAAVRRVMMFSSESSHLLSIHVNGDSNLLLQAEDIDFSRSAREELVCSELSAPDKFAIGVNAQHFLEILSSIASDNVILHFIDPSRPMTLREDDPKSSLVLLTMPMLLEGAD